ncbi:MAG TPA: polysaccharide biosynthesis tyrosine autokinase [Caulobacteraceae bacterium]|nr:polysaccharide biosynthesis tyrosine autokinase [Caulobacteraceae bacterium]
MTGGHRDDMGDGEPTGQGYLTVSRPVIVRPNSVLRDVAQAELPQSDGDLFDFLRYWQFFVKHRYIMAGVVAAALLLGLVATLMTTPVYRATSVIQIEQQAPTVTNLEGAEALGQSGGDRDFLQTQYELLNSRSLAERVVERLNLAEDEAFLRQRSSSPLARLGGEAPLPASLDARRRRAVSIVRSNLEPEPVRGSSLVRISYDSPDRTTAARIANAVAENFIGANLDRRFGASAYARKFLEERLAQVKARLEQSERELVAYAAQQNLVSVGSGESDTSGGAAAQSLTAADLASMNSALSAAKGERIRAEQRWRQAASTPVASLSDVLQSPTIQSLRQTRAALQAEYQEKLGVYKADYPQMVQLKSRMDEIDRQIANEAQNIKQSLRNQYEVAVRQENALQQQVSGLSSGVLDLRHRSIQYNIIQREVDTNRTLYDGLLQRYKEIGVAGGVGANNVAIVDRAIVPSSPYKPNLLFNLAIAGALGLLLAIGCAFIAESIDDTITAPGDIESKLGIPLLGSVPELPKGLTPTEALADTRSAFSEAYYSVRTALQFSTSQGAPRQLLITSARPSEGKSTSAVALATNFARLGMRVLLVDGDLRNPSLHRALEAENTVGLSNYLAGREQLSALAQPTPHPNLFFVSCGPLPPSPAELLAGGNIERLIADAALDYELLIIDGPPVMGLADAPILASVVGGTVLVVEANSTRQTIVKTALRRLQVGRARVVGAILTKYDARRAGYGYGYGDDAYSYDYGARRLEAT